MQFDAEVRKQTPLNSIHALIIVIPGLINHPGKKWTTENWICWFYESILPNSVDFTKFCLENFYLSVRTFPKITFARPYISRNNFCPSSDFRFSFRPFIKSTKSTNSSYIIDFKNRRINQNSIPSNKFGILVIYQTGKDNKAECFWTVYRKNISIWSFYSIQE